MDLPAYYSLATLLGATLLGVDVPPGLLKDLRESLSDASWGEFRTLARTLTPLVWAYGLGSTIGAVGLSAAAYRASLAMIVAHRRHAAAQQDRQPTDN